MTEDPLRTVARALSPFGGRPVTVSVTDAPAGWSFVSIDGTVTSVDTDDDRLLVTLDHGRGCIALFGDMIDGVDADTREVRISYRAGNVTVAPDDARPSAGRHLRSLRG
jgi:hypothetical protein